MTQKFANNYSTTVAATFGSGDTQLTLASVAGLPSLAGGHTFLLTVYRLTGVVESGHEVVRVTGIAGNIATVDRAVEGAAASQFNVGDRVELRVTAGSMQPLADHVANTANPHGTTKAHVGLSNVDNTSDINKPVSTAQQAALNLKVNLSGGTLTGPVNSNKGADIASAATINLDTATGEYVNITGTTTITAVTLTSGAMRRVKFNGALTLTHDTNLQLPGLANITTVAGDKAIFFADGAVVHCLYFKADGTSVVSGSSGSKILLGQTTQTNVASIDIEGFFDATYDNYELEYVGLRPITDNQDAYVQFKVAGAYPTSAYSSHLFGPNGAQSSYTGGSVIFPGPGSAMKVANLMGNYSYASCDITVRLTNPSDTVTYKKISFTGSKSQSSDASNAQLCFGAGLYNGSTGAVTGVRIKAASGNISGTVRVYGIKKS